MMRLTVTWGLLLVAAVLSKIDCHNYTDPLVKIKWSWLRGFTREILDVPVHHFLGIPYALPPVGPLRFKPSIPLEATYFHHKGVYNATSYQFGCIQTPEDEVKHSKIPSSENCLFINVYTPASLSGTREVNKKPKLPVLVFIHGSGFVYGSSGNPHIYGGYLAALGDMIFVVFNYRLGALGLMYGHPTKIPGNLALWDQKAALQWVQKNIDAFGGDPDRVTMMGHSAGATFSTMHLMSTQTRHLYQQAMVMSGTACQRSGLDSPTVGLAKTRLVANRVNCSSDASAKGFLNDEEIECLMRIDPLVLASAQGPLELSESTLTPPHCSSSIFLPTYGDLFLPHSTDSLLHDHKHVQGKPILVGKVPIETFVPISVANFSSAVDYIKSSIANTTGIVKPARIDDILKYYLSDNETDSHKLTQAAIAAINDLCQHCPLLKFSTQWAINNPVYQYYYTYVTESQRNDPFHAFGPLHADDTKILFGLPFKDPEQYSDHDRAMSKLLIQLWSHFVRKGSMVWPPIASNFGSKYQIVYQYEINDNTTFNYKNIGIDSDAVICPLLP